MNRQRFESLIEALEKVPDAQFDMSVWQHKRSCGTVGCAVGHYVDANPDCGIIIRNGVVLGCIGHTGGALGIIADHFGISQDNAEYLFLADHYPNGEDVRRQQVLNRLTEFFDIHCKDA